MLVWRICDKRHVRGAFSGRGSEKHGGRWNPKGERMVYTASTLSLAALELFVHLDPMDIPDDLRFVVATIDDSASTEELSVRKLPKNWRDDPAPAILQEIGSKWLREIRSFALFVPSAVNPEEKNILLNPLHPDRTALANVRSKPFVFDPRMWK
jgi:RES domain-containing protein